MRIVTTHDQHNPLLIALESLNVQIEFIKWNEALSKSNWTGISGFYGNLFDEIKDWTGLHKLKLALTHAGVPYVFWNRDAPWNVGMKLHNRIAMRIWKPADIYLAHSMQGAQDFGGDAYYFPNAAQPAYYRDTNLQTLSDELTYKYDVSFFGSLGNGKDRNARARHQFLATLEYKLKERMPNIRFKVTDTSVKSLSFDEQLALIRTTKINLNYGAMCDLPNNPSWGLPERAFGIPAAGGFLLTDDRKSIPLTFSQGACTTFTSVETCVHTIMESLADFYTLRQKSELLHCQVLESHTYRQRALQLVGLLQDYPVNAGLIS